MFGSRLALFKPLGPLITAVRNNCPWHRNNFTPYYFPFYQGKKMKKGSVEGRLKTPGGRLIVMRRVLEEKYFIGWHHQTKPPEKRLSCPL